MELSPSAFEDLHPGRRLELQFPLRGLCHDTETEGEDAVISVTVLDSELHIDEATTHCVAMLVPLGREEDWIYSTEGGQWQLLASAAVSRMILFSCHSANSQPEETVNLSGGPDRKHNETTVANKLRQDQEEQASRDRKVSRLQVGVGEDRKSTHDGSRSSWSGAEDSLKRKLSRLVLALAPKIQFQHGLPDVPFVSYTDNVIHRIILEECFSPLTGFMVVEDVELRQEIEHNELYRDREECSSRREQSEQQSHIPENDASASSTRVIRRRLRFKRMPNLIQTEVRVSVSQPCTTSGSTTMALKTVDHDVLVHKYLAPIVAGLVLASPCLEACTASETVPSVLCIGVGGGALPSFLHKHFPFRIQAVDLDEVVLRLARQHFGLWEDDSLEVKACDGLNVIADVAETVVKLGLVSDSVVQTWQQLTDPIDMINPADSLCSDVDAGDPKLDLSSPPECFLSKAFLFSAMISLYQGGLLAMNVVSHNLESFERLACALKEVFAHVYALHVEDDINVVVFALSSELLSTEVVGSISSQVRELVGTHMIERIYKL